MDDGRCVRNGLSVKGLRCTVDIRIEEAILVSVVSLHKRMRDRNSFTLSTSRFKLVVMQWWADV